MVEDDTRTVAEILRDDYQITNGSLTCPQWMDDEKRAEVTEAADRALLAYLRRTNRPFRLARGVESE